MIPLNETFDGCFEVVVVVEESSCIFSSASVDFVEHESNCGVNRVVVERSWVSVDVRSEVEYVSIDDEIVGEVCELVPVVTYSFSRIRKMELRC